MKTLSKKTKHNYITLPKSLVEDIRSLELTDTNQSHAFKFVGLILRDSFIQYGDIFSYTPFPSNYLNNTFRWNYMDWVQPLISKGIINRSSYYSYINKSECYSYSINKSYWLSTLVLCNSIQSQLTETVKFKEIIKVYVENETEMTKHFTQDFNSLTVEYDKLRDIINQRVATLSIKDFRVNEAIRENVVTLINSEGNKYYVGRDVAIEKAIKDNKSLIQDMSIFRIADEETFINEKKASLLFSYGNSVDTIQKKAYRAKRNITNMRLDTNITNMCSELVDEICVQNDLIQIDLKNSQFTILSHILKGKLTSDDYNLFKRLSVTGELYDYIKHEMSLEGRKEAKKTMFELLFSARNNNTSGKVKLKKMFPTVINWVDTYKKDNGDSQFSIMLQNTESGMFIDGLFVKVKKAKLFCLTKHDSLIVRRKDEAKVMKIVNEFFGKIDLEYTVDITTPEKILAERASKTKVDTQPVVIEKTPEKRDMAETVNVFEVLRDSGLSGKDVSEIITKIDSSNCSLGVLVRTMAQMYKDQRNYNDYVGPVINKEHIEFLMYNK